MRIIKLLFLVFIPAQSFSLNSDSLKIISYTHDAIKVMRNDSSLTGFQKYTSKNNLGNTGLAIFKNDLSGFSFPETGFNYWLNNFSYYLIDNKNLLYYNTNRPYTKLKYVVGSKKEQNFGFLHTQNINKHLNFAATFQRIRSEGFYLKQNTNHNHFSLGSNYISEQKKYILFSNIIFNSLKNSENGGIKNDSSFEFSTRLDKKLVPINLNSAQRHFKNRSFFLQQELRLSKDSMEKGTFIVHSFSIEDNAMVYKDSDPNSGFYRSVYNDTLKTLDSVYYYKMINEFGIRRKFSSSTIVSIWGNNEYVRLKSGVTDNILNNYILKSSIISSAEDSSDSFFGEASFVFSGPYKNDYHVKGGYFKSFGSARLEISGFANEVNSFFIYNFYRSNNFNWKNNFKKINTRKISLSFYHPKFLNAGFDAYNFKNHLVFDSHAQPVQLKSSNTLFSLYAGKRIRFSKWCFFNEVKYQYTPNFSGIRLPEWITSHSLFYENSLFKKALDTQVGIDAYYNSSYLADAYMPATGQFYLQNEKKIGNYIFADLFLNLKIKSVRLFFKLEHFYSGLLGNTYYKAPHYPAPDRSFKFGLSWVFNN
jgi:hypothetical protein